MGTGYTRKDTANNIADGNIINASDLDLEFDGLQSAFDNTSGHTHDGTDGEGAPIEKVGPAQDIVITATALRPKTDNTVDLGTSSLEFKNLYIDGTAYLDSVDIDGGSITGLTELTVDNISLNGSMITTTNTNGNLNLRANGTGIISVDATDVNFGDSDKATFGDSADLQIYHDGTHSYIDDAGTGDLRLRSNGIVLEGSDGTNGILVDTDGEVQLYYNGASKLATTNTGIAVTGDVAASDNIHLTSDASKITFGADNEIELFHSADSGLTLNHTSTADDVITTLTIRSNQATLTDGEAIGRLDFYTSTSAGGAANGSQARINVDATATYSATLAGSRMEFFTTASNGTLALSMYLDDEQNAHLNDNKKLILGTGSDLQIYHDGSNSYVDATTVGHLFLQTQAADKDVRIMSDDGSGGLANYLLADGSTGALNAYHYGDLKLATTSTGIAVTGGFTATDGSTITTADNSIQLELISTDADASVGSIFSLYRNSASPADGDDVGQIEFHAKNDANQKILYADILAELGDVTDGTEDGHLSLRTVTAGTVRRRLKISNAELVINEDSIDSDFRVESDTKTHALFVQGSDGMVGIGKSVPAASLHVNGGTINTVGRFHSTDASAGIYLTDGTTTGGEAAIHGLLTTGNNLEVRGLGKVVLATGTTDKVTVLSDGKVGIGDTNPTHELSVVSAGDTTVEIKSTGTGDADALLILDSAASGESEVQFFHDGTHGASIQWYTDGSPDLNIITEAGTDGVIDFQPNNSLAMRIDADGQVGINYDDPQHKLDVNGTGRFLKTNNSQNLILETTDTDANGGPILELYRNPGQAGAVSDSLGEVQFYGLNAASEKTQFAEIISTIKDPTNGSEDGRIQINLLIAGVNTQVFAADGAIGEIVVNDSSKDMNFRVESNNDTAAFFVDGATGSIGLSSNAPDTHIPQTHNAGKRSLVSESIIGPQVVLWRNDASIAQDDYIGGYLFRTNDASGAKYGGMIAKGDDSTGNGILEFYPVNTTYESSNTVEGIMQLSDTNDLFLRTGGIRVGRSEKNVYTTTEETIALYHNGSGTGDTHTHLVSRNGAGGDHVFRHTVQGTVKSEIEENGDFMSATNSYTATSDERLKENIVAANSQWDDIKALQFKNYSMIDAELDAPNMLGVMAQDLQASGMGGLVKQTFKTNGDDEPVLDADGNQEEYLSVKYSVIYMKAIKALQEAIAKIETLETKVAALEAE
mgnify:FL=1